jgi:hypothetical protein
MILLQYNQIRREGTLCMFSQSIIKQQKEYDEEKAQEGAKKGF